MLTKLRRRPYDLLDRLARAKADPYFLALFRITYALVGILVALRTYEQAGYLWHPGSAAYKLGVYFLLPAIIALLLCVLVGFGGRVAIALHFVALACLNFSFPIVGYLDFRFNQAGAFWLLFMRVNRVWSLDALLFRERVSREPAPSAWPVHFMGVSLGLWFLNAGFLKIVDPLWREGLGFYYVMLLPWIKPASLNFILDHPFVLTLFNYLAIIFETTFLILYLFRWTRPIAILLGTFFFINLIYPLRIDPIGQFGLTWLVALLSVTHVPSKLRPALSRFLPRWPKLDAPASETPGRRLRLRKYFIVATALYILYLSAVFHVRVMPYYLFKQGTLTFVDYPYALLEGPAEAARREPKLVRGMKWALDSLYRPLDKLNRPLLFLNQYTTSMQFNGLFGVDHVLGIYLYRVELEMDDGSRVEPVPVFREDMTAGPYSDGVFTPRYLQGVMYDITGICHRLAMKPGYTLTAGEVDVLKRVINSGLYPLDEARARHVRRVVLKVRPIIVPDDYEGDVHTWERQGWTDFYVYEPSTGEYKIENVPEKYPLHMPLKHFSNAWLVLSP
jgi:hypothetical protein